MSKLDQSLDTIIEGEKKTGRGGRRGGGRGRGRGRGARSASSSFTEPTNPLSRDDDDSGDAGPERRERFTRRARSVPYYEEDSRAPLDDESEWKHDMFHGNGAHDGQRGGAGGARVEPVSKILVSGLDPEVSSDDVKEIFAQVGQIQKAVVHYDQNGKSLGTAEVTFNSTASATKAVKEFDGAEVDGKPMYIKVVGSVIAAPRVIKKRPQPTVTKESYFGGYDDDDYDDYRPRRGSFGGRGRGRPARRSRGTGRGRGRGGRGGGGGRGKKDKEEVSTADLDKELDQYQKARGGGDAAATGQPAA